MLNDDQVVPVALLIAEKQVLAMRRVDAGPMLLSFFDGRHRRMLVTGVRDAELGEPGRHRDLLRREHACDYQLERARLTLWRHTTYRETS